MTNEHDVACARLQLERDQLALQRAQLRLAGRQRELQMTLDARQEDQLFVIKVLERGERLDAAASALNAMVGSRGKVCFGNHSTMRPPTPRFSAAARAWSTTPASEGAALSLTPATSPPPSATFGADWPAATAPSPSQTINVSESPSIVGDNNRVQIVYMHAEDLSFHPGNLSRTPLNTSAVPRIALGHATVNAGRVRARTGK